MADGAVIENLSTRKLLGILAALGLAQAAFFAVGAFFAPVPSSSMDFEMVKCADQTKGAAGHWFHLRPPRCDLIESLATYTPSSFDLREIVFIAQMPHARNNLQLEYSPWFQFLLGLVHVEVEYSDVFKYVPGAKLMLEVRMGVRTRESAPDAWEEYADVNVTRTLDCTIDPSKKSEGNFYTCDTLDLFELGSNNYPFYLLNVRIPIDTEACRRDPVATPNCQIGKINELHVVAIHQNGGFTAVWLWLKTLLCPIVIAACYWFNRRLSLLPRPRLLLEKAILALGMVLVLLDAPLEWLSLVARLPCLLLLSDLRQGLFYTVLFSFWLIFAGEHLIDDPQLNNLSAYRINLSLVAVASLALLVYDMAERGMQLADPFYSVWSSEWGATVAYISIYVALACTLAYFVFLFYKIVVVWNSIRRKRAAHLYRTSENRRLKFLMLFTLLCSALTIAAYFMRQFGEASLHGDSADDSILTHSTSAFFTGTFGMWNIYVLLLIAMYAPSHKQYQGAHGLIDENEDLMSGEERGTESNPLTTFLKPAQD
ncbi:mig-14 [Pristionchus pacificus]|uniref:Mig-14 n=1 Tax=Pristionchus pacificus TaxID=54126 RepID=A0A2A6CX10_PRIPA|nr:mig-14 [Pristionchus pacificus]|eukprot:PDM82630.1 mig-14 [Pristionchus pacificus]